MPTPPILLVRHAESEWNAAGRWQGHGDPPLSERGRAQARAAAESLAGSRIEVLVCSDLRRAQETAAALGDALGLAPSPDPRLRELDVGAWEGLSRSEIERRHPEDLAAFDSGDPDARPTGGETLRELAARVGSALAWWVERHPGARLALVTHLGVIRVLSGVSDLDNAGWCWIESDPGARDGAVRAAG